jgi:hypothetical protein
MTAEAVAVEAVCGGCNRLIVVSSGEPVPGWERARFVSASDHLCGTCKDPIINSLAAALPLGG